MRTAFLTSFMEGYGLTETCAASIVTATDETTYGCVGIPCASIEYRLVDVPDMEYFVKARSYDAIVQAAVQSKKDVKKSWLINGVFAPRGEIQIRGPAVFSGYYKQQDITNEVLSKDGWFSTGDIGMLMPDGNLRIIDRKKNLFKLAQGEYVAAEKIESVYKSCNRISNIYVHGDSTETYLVALVFPDEENVNITDPSSGKKMKLVEILKNEKLNKKLAYEVLKEMHAAAKKEKLRGFEVVKKIVLLGEDFTVENGLLTPSFKLKRHVAAQTFSGAIKGMYADTDADSQWKALTKEFGGDVLQSKL